MEDLGKREQVIQNILKLVAMQEKIYGLEQDILSVIKRMELIELATLDHCDELRQTKEYRNFLQAIKDMQGYMPDALPEDMDYYLKMLEETLSMHKETLAAYEEFLKRYEEVFGKVSLDSSKKEDNLESKMKDALIEEVISLVYPNITDELRPIVRKWYVDKTILELEDIKRNFLMELNDEDIKRSV